MRRVLGLLPLFAIGCVDGEGSGDKLFKVDPKIEAIEAQLSPANIAAGESATVACVASFDDGSTKTLTAEQVTLSATPAQGVSVSALSVRGTISGTYLIACKTSDFEGAPSTLTVTPGAAARIIATLDRAAAGAGEPVAVTCTHEDEHGNRSVAASAVVSSEPSRGMNVGDRTVTGERPGTYSIWCTDGALPATPASLEITFGLPVTLRTTLDRYTVLAGERVIVTCSAEDAFGNPALVETNFTATPTPAQADEDSFVATAAGEYSVACSIASPPIGSTPVTLTVNPGLPARLEITGIDPMKAVYGRTESVELLVHIEDAYGNTVPAATMTVAANPQTAAVPSGGTTALLIGDGNIELIATVTGQTHQNMTVTDSTTVFVDGQPPNIEIIFPRRAEIVTAVPGQPITIRGRVTDVSSAVAGLAVNGNVVTVAPNGDFTATMIPRWGINLIEAAAGDEAGNTRALSQSFELASEYRRASPSRIASGRIMDGLIAHLGQAALDDNNADVDDLATIARLAIQNTDVRALIPNPVTSFHSDCSIPFVSITGDLRLHLDNLTFGTPIIDLTAQNGGLRVRVEIPNVFVAMHTSGDVCEIGVGISGSARATRIVVTANLQLSASGGQVIATMATPSVSITGLSINLNLPAIIDWAIDGIINLFSGAIANEMEDAFAEVIRDEIPPVVEQFLESMELGTSFTLPAPLSTTLSINARLGMLAFDTTGGDLGEDTTIYTTGVITPEPAGGILQETQTLPTFSANRSLAVALGYDLINQALYSVWYGGALDIDIDQAFFPNQQPNGSNMLSAEASARALLPPVLGPSNDPNYPVAIALGDLELDLDLDGISGFPPINTVVYATVFANANATIDASGAIVLTVAPNPQIALDFTTPLDGIVDMVALTTQLESTLSQLVPVLLGQVLRGIPLPTFDLSSMAGGVLPQGIVLGLGGASTRFHPSYLILEGNLVQIP